MFRSSSGAFSRALKQASGRSQGVAEQQVLPSAAVTTQASQAKGSDAAAATTAQQQQQSGRRSWKKPALIGLGAAAATAGITSLAIAEEEADHGLHAPEFPWSHSGFFSAYDHASIRRGHQVYSQVCAACHSVEQIHYRNLVGVAYTEEEVKEMAAETEVTDGPNEEGEQFERPGRLSDPLPRPYPNEEAARYANGGAYPPDLSLITKARHNGQNYVFSLLTGYREPPAGVTVREGLYYNPYFPGGAIAMPKMLADGGTEYDDEEIPATESQQAKDISTFLAWAAEPEHDERKLSGVKWLFILSLVWATAIYYKRWKWSPIKSRRIIVDAVN
ncbi:hypothetical protein WJX84_007423 [Apatococcus fuscideae]|uniref:Cytochrome c domain-containing protein n=1 Tax=Apatococcus fuscideae TaxID=2026836 RepID=A0AAW1SRD3_9CHLO